MPDFRRINRLAQRKSTKNPSQINYSVLGRTLRKCAASSICEGERGGGPAAPQARRRRQLAEKHEMALQAALAEGQTGVVQLLLNHGADVNVQGRRYGSALQAARRMGNEEVVQLLLDHGASRTINARDGTAPLIVADLLVAQLGYGFDTREGNKTKGEQSKRERCILGPGAKGVRGTNRPEEPGCARALAEPVVEWEEQRAESGVINVPREKQNRRVLSYVRAELRT
ncbi:hypothetical protein C8J57DRAFT_1254739 [Mycena rebaudengoi]|nr:hypothetical protein C8J57DRAFT_1254739 [Mycena rebaudengoi]